MLAKGRGNFNEEGVKLFFPDSKDLEIWAGGSCAVSVKPYGSNIPIFARHAKVLMTDSGRLHLLQLPFTNLYSSFSTQLALQNFPVSRNTGRYIV